MARAREGDPAAFAEFWAAYPVSPQRGRVGKGAARKAWAKIPDPPLPAILAALDAQAASDQWQREGGRYIPLPATWLNQTRWEDDAGQPTPMAGVTPATQGNAAALRRFVARSKENQ